MTTRVFFSKNAWEEYRAWEAEDKKVFKKINTLINSIPDSPHRGLGMPEPLKEELAGLWSRRIIREHRLVYAIEGLDILIYSCRYHFDSK